MYDIITGEPQPGSSCRQHAPRCVWDSPRPEWRDALLARLPVSEVWGIASRLERRLAAQGITTIAQLRAADPVAIRTRFNVAIMRTVLELAGTPAVTLEEERVGKEQLIFSRSFSGPVTSREGCGRSSPCTGSRPPPGCSGTPRRPSC
ncbi:hypothetical protein GCM10027090_38760 [Sinomonas soli]